MPKIYEYKCNQCDFNLGWGWGGYLYVINEDGERIVCNHPGEESTIIETLGAVRFWNKKKMLKKWSEHIGYNRKCVCHDCLKRFDADVAESPDALPSQMMWYSAIILDIDFAAPRDERICPECNSENISTISELIMKPCPKCKNGNIKKSHS